MLGKKSREIIPHYHLERTGDRSIVSNLGRSGISQIVTVSPAFDVPDNFFVPAIIRGYTMIRPLHKIEDKLLGFEVSSYGNENVASQNLEFTLDGMEACVNALTNPAAYRELLYRDPRTSKSRTVARLPLFKTEASLSSNRPLDAF